MLASSHSSKTSIITVDVISYHGISAILEQHLHNNNARDQHHAITTASSSSSISAGGEYRPKPNCQADPSLMQNSKQASS